MGKFKDISGKRFGRLTALYRLNNYHKKRVYWLWCELYNVKYATVWNRVCNLHWTIEKSLEINS